MRWPLQPSQPPTKKNNSNRLSVHQWIRSVNHASQQLTSPIVSYPWNFRHRLVRHYWYIYVYIYIYIAPSIYNTWFDNACIHLKIKTWSQRLEVYTLVWEQSPGNMEVESVPFCNLCEALRCSWREKWGETMDTLPFKSGRWVKIREDDSDSLE